jgi:nicotinamide mononucleotide (NMN) deamidase PncC
MAAAPTSEKRKVRMHNAMGSSFLRGNSNALAAAITGVNGNGGRKRERPGGRLFTNS